MLSLSLIMLFVGPLLYQWLRRGGLIARGFDRVIMVVLVVVVAFMLVPEAISGLGWIAFVLMLLGYLAPGLLESGVRRAARAFHMFSLLFALVGLALHALIDGAGLAGSASGSSDNLALAIVLHRFGVGLALWLILKPAFGTAWAIAALLLIAAATVVGYFMSSQLLPFAGEGTVLVIQALIIGTIIHSLLHREHVHGLGPGHKTG
ncbi:MAG: hypothetical protein HKN58_10560 [Xanthomonadales bacterium]|nr:hypothetical protein [Xanthomonadales bacterium]